MVSKTGATLEYLKVDSLVVLWAIMSANYLVGWSVLH